MSAKASPSPEGIRVLIVDSDSMGGQLIASALRRCRDHFEVSGPTNNLHETLQLMAACKPNVVVLSMEMQNGAETASSVLHRLRQNYPLIAMVVLLRTIDRDPVIQAFRAGVRGVISRTDSFKALAKCLRSVHQGQVWASTREINYLLEALVETKPRSIPGNDNLLLLTKREQQITRLVADGLSNRDIANMLALAEHTVSNYLYRIFDKIGVSNRVQLILYTLSRRTSVPERLGSASFDDEPQRKMA
jgi:DNA-binding NarL/FixJ family response regulator